MTYATTPQALPEAIHDTEDSVARIADFARVVLGQRDDPVAVAIVVDAARELAATVVAGIRWAATDIEVAVTGGLADELTDEGSVLGAAFAAELRAADVDPTRLRLAPPPVEGACALATDDDPGAYATLVSRHEVRVPRASGATAGSYLRGVVELLEEVRSSESGAIVRAAHAFADAIASGGMVHTFGTGHSHLLAEELFYRAGGLARIDPILDEGLMLHVSAVASTWHERRSDLAERVASRHDIRPGDVVVVASNSGGNRVTTDMARLARNRGSVVVAVTSVAHATSDQARHSDDQRLHELADIVLDNHGTPGDAAVRVPGLAEPVAPTSTVVGAALLQAVVAEAVAILVGRGIDPEVFRSANTAGGDAANSALIARYSPRVAAL